MPGLKLGGLGGGGGGGMGGMGGLKLGGGGGLGGGMKLDFSSLPKKGEGEDEGDGAPLNARGRGGRDE